MGVCMLGSISPFLILERVVCEGCSITNIRGCVALVFSASTHVYRRHFCQFLWVITWRNRVCTVLLVPLDVCVEIMNTSVTQPRP